MFEQFDNIFFGIGKISGTFNAIDQGVHDALPSSWLDSNVNLR